MGKKTKLKIRFGLIMTKVALKIPFSLQARINRQLKKVVNAVLEKSAFNNGRSALPFEKSQFLGNVWLNAYIPRKPSGYSKPQSYYTLMNIRDGVTVDPKAKHGQKFTPDTVSYELHFYYDLGSGDVLPEDIFKFFNFREDGDFDLENYFREHIYTREGMRLLIELERVLRKI